MQWTQSTGYEMANETLNSGGAYATCITSASVATGALSTAGNATDIGTAIATEDLYPTLDFKLKATAGTVTAGDIVNLYRRPHDGTDQAPIPANTSAHTKQDWVGSFKLVSNSEARYLNGVRNLHVDDEYYIENTGAASITLELKVRGNTYGTA